MATAAKPTRPAGRLILTAGYIQRCAASFRAQVQSFRSWVLFSADNGDAWLLQPEDSLAVCLSESGKAIRGIVAETPEHFTIDFEHCYRIEGEDFVLWRLDGPVRAVPGYPVEDILLAISASQRS